MPDKLKVMVVDDEKEFCQNVKDILEMKSYEVTTTYDGFTALEFIEQNGFDLVILDVRMPGINGVETFKKIKILIPGTPVIMVTAYTFEDLLKEALREGAFGILRKPLDFDKLFIQINKAIPDGALVYGRTGAAGRAKERLFLPGKAHRYGQAVFAP